VPKVTFKLTRPRARAWKPLNAKLRSFQEIAEKFQISCGERGKKRGTTMNRPTDVHQLVFGAIAHLSNCF
jgi:hypothetical protein